MNYNPTKIQTKSMDYIKMDIIVPRLLYYDNSPLSSFSATISSHPIYMMPIVDNAITKIQYLDYTIIHRCLSHTCNKNIKEMCSKYTTLLNLSTRIKLDKQTQVNNY